MKIAAIIAEYNPFHLGHEWQLQEIRRRFGPDCAVMAVMSGCFTQRGEPAVLDKWSRARMAMACGVDLVVELPFAYAAASAERFASGGVQLVQAAGFDCHLVFGSESGDLDQLQQLSGCLADEAPGFKQLLHHYLDQGESFPAARQQAVAAWTGNPGLAALLESSNNILAVEYLKAIRALPHSRLIPCAFPRRGQAYRDSDPEQESFEFSSALSIRRSLGDCLQGDAPDLCGLARQLAGAMPPPSLAVLLEKIQAGPGPLLPECLADSILGLLRTRPADEIDQVPGMGEGLGRRLAEAAARPATHPAAAPPAAFATALGPGELGGFDPEPDCRARAGLHAVGLGLGD